MDETGEVETTNLYGPAVDQLFASESATGEVLWAVTDNQNTVRDIAKLDATAEETSIVAQREYDIFGNLLSVTGDSAASAQIQAGYTGRAYDPDANLHYYRARWYDSVANRFINEDPIGFAAGDVNVQRYVENSFANMIDPSGLEGHHAVVQESVAKLGHAMTEEAKEVFLKNTLVFYCHNHGNHTWHVTHPEYNKQSIKLIQNFIDALKGKKISGPDAQKIVVALLTNDFDKLPGLLKKTKEARAIFSTLTDYLRTARLGDSLAGFIQEIWPEGLTTGTEKQRSARRVAQYILNEGKDVPLPKLNSGEERLLKAFRAITKSKPTWAARRLLSYLGQHLGKALGGLVIFGAYCEGANGGVVEEHQGVVGGGLGVAKHCLTPWHIQLWAYGCQTAATEAGELLPPENTMNCQAGLREELRHCFNGVAQGPTHFAPNPGLPPLPLAPQ